MRRPGFSMPIGVPAAGRGEDKPRAGWRIALCLLAPSLFLISGCDKFPADMDGSLATIAQRKTFTVGTAAPLPSSAEQLVARLEKATGSKARIVTGPLEPLIADLEAGKLDLIVAPFRKDSPLVADVSLSPPIARAGEEIEWHAAMKNGENRWIMLVETEARGVAPPGGTE